jgi:hypothetical protein
MQPAEGSANRDGEPCVTRRDSEARLHPTTESAWTNKWCFRLPWLNIAA